jgi:hypothetical protein
MDPSIWSNLPYDLLEYTANFCDIDSRRALGFKPRKLPPMDLPPFRPNWGEDYDFIIEDFVYRERIFKYITETKTIIAFEIQGYNEIFWDVKTDMLYDPEEDKWTFGPNSTYHYIFGDGYQDASGSVRRKGVSYQLVQNPVFV